MDRCTNTEIGLLLHGYELGILDDREKAAFEAHLLECDFCYAAYSEHEAVLEHIRGSRFIRREISLIAQSDYPAPDHKSPFYILWPIGKMKPLFVPGLALVLLALIFFIFRPWQLEFRSTKDAVASGNRLAIVDFANIASPDDSLRTGAIVANLLTVELSRLSAINLVSTERVRFLLGSAGKTGKDINDPAIAAEFARNAGLRWLLYGSLINKDGRTILTTQIADAETGNVISGHRLLSEDNESIFSLVDRLAGLITQDLSLPISGKGRQEMSLIPPTVHSLDAYRYYLEGIDYYEKYYYDNAEACFEKALSYDSTFAMAYYYLSFRKDPALINEAIQFKEYTSDLDQYYIECHYLISNGMADSARIVFNKLLAKYPDEKRAYYLLGLLDYSYGKLPAAIRSFLKAIEIDPAYKIVYNELAYAYDKIGNFEMALWAINKYIELAPDEANPYDTRGEFYALHGMPDKAMESYLKAIEIKPDFYSAIEYVGHIFLLNRQYKKADSCYQILEKADSKFTSTMSGFLRTLIPYNQGRLQQTLHMFDSCLIVFNDNSLLWSASRIHYLKSFIYQALHNYNSALRENRLGKDIEIKSSPNKLPDFRFFYIQMLAQDGQFDQARIEAEKLRQDSEKLDGCLHDYWYAMGAVAFEQKDYANAISYLNNIFKSDEVCRCFHVHYLLGRAYLESERLADAINEFESQMYIYDYLHIRHAVMNADLHYYLGLAYEKSNWNDRAIEQYRLFLNIFKDADPDLMALYDASARLKRLQQNP
jgi:tetratricopeptide (TPR) repeat protein